METEAGDGSEVAQAIPQCPGATATQTVRVGLKKPRELSESQETG